MISVSNVSMRYGSKMLFDEVTTAFIPGRRYGLTGPNGSGKTTFMKILTGELEAQKGTVVRPRKWVCCARISSLSMPIALSTP